jgi:two-component system NarL family sensor kinase
MNAPQVAAIVFGLSAAVSGWFILQGARARLSGLGLLLAGAATLAGCATLGLDLDGAAPVLFRLAGCLAAPAALVVYPRTRWPDALSFVLTTLVVASGCLSVAWSDAVEPMGYVIGGALLLHVWWGLERGDEQDRRALTWCSLAWISAGLLAMFVGFVQESSSTGDSMDVSALVVALAAVGPPAMVVGVLRPDLVDVRGLVTRAVVAGTVLTTFIAVAIGVTSVFEDARGRPLETAPVAVLCALLAFGVHPLEVMLRGVVDQLLFGDRPDPLTAATGLADRIGDDPALALDAIREALVLPYAGLRVGTDLLASSGSEVTHTRVLPLRLGGDVRGEVVVGLRPGDLSLSAADENVLRIVTPLLGQTLRARALAQDLKESRGAAITAIEDERLRLRRDLHDGLGPTLTGVAFSADAARNHIRSAPDRAEALLVGLRADTAAAIAEIRRLVEGLRPPALDELGLDGAIRQHASGLRTDGGRLVQVSVTVPDRLPAFSAAVEVAAYRIVVEALTNVTRHAAASTARVDLRVDRELLQVTVDDDGGSSSSWVPGVGLSSMRERAQQVGGTLTVSPDAHGGRVRAIIPLQRASS